MPYGWESSMNPATWTIYLEIPLALHSYNKSFEKKNNKIKIGVFLTYERVIFVV